MPQSVVNISADNLNITNLSLGPNCDFTKNGTTSLVKTHVEQLNEYTDQSVEKYQGNARSRFSSQTRPQMKSRHIQHHKRSLISSSSRNLPSGKNKISSQTSMQTYERIVPVLQNKYESGHSSRVPPILNTRVFNRQNSSSGIKTKCLSKRSGGNAVLR